MSAADVVAGLLVAGVTLHLADGQIRYRGPAGAYVARERALVAADRAGVAGFLTRHGEAAPWRALLDGVAIWPACIQTLLASRAAEIEAAAGVSRADAEVRAFGQLRASARAPVVSIALAAAHGIDARAFGHQCNALIGRPGPASAADDAKVAGSILCRLGSRPMKAAITPGEGA